MPGGHSGLVTVCPMVGGAAEDFGDGETDFGGEGGGGERLASSV